MIRRKKVKVTREEEELVEVKCNWCNKNMLGGKLIGGTSGSIFEIGFDWGSTYDGDLYEGAICDKCFKEELKTKLNLKRTM